MRSGRRSFARRSPPGCMKTPTGRVTCAKAFWRASPRDGSASRRISRARSCSSRRAPPTSIPVIFSTPTAATRQADMAKARITVVGAGLMGHGLAQVFALGGHDVAIYDSFAASLETVKDRIAANLRDLGDDPTAVERVRPTPDLADALRDADYVVEAVSEDL